MIGKIIATEETPSPTEVEFVTHEEKADKNQYVEFNTAQGRVIGIIKDMVKANKYFDQPESISQLAKIGEDIADKFPAKEWEYTVGKVKALGVYNGENELIKRPTKPSAPGTEVKEPDNETLKDFLNFKENGMKIGKIEHHGTQVKVGLTEMFQKHLAVLAQTGAGKTHTVSVLIEELLSRTKEEGRPSAVVIDVHGEYSGFAQTPEYRNKVKVVKGENFKIPVSSLNVSDFSLFLPGMSRAQERELHHAIAMLRNDNKPYSINEIIEQVVSDKEMNEKLQGALTSWLGRLDSDMFAETGSSVTKLTEPGKLTILDMGKMIDQKEKQILVSYVAQRLFSKRRKREVPPFILFVEEAHNFAKEAGESEKTMAKNIIETIAREGRKFGASLCLVSQRPMKLSTTALSQCNTQVILRITNPHDLDHISRTSEGIDQESLETLTTLRVGEAMVVGSAVSHPVFLKIRGRNSEEIDLGKNLEEQARDYETNMEQDRKDVEAFM